jgi:Zn-dependent protease/CBS domain-containing protein
MDQDIKLGTIEGIPVGVNWSILFIFLLVAWELAEWVLPSDAPGGATGVNWTVALVASVLFFTSLLAHEASHSIVARRFGIGVKRITLWLFGGVSELESEALSPRADFLIAVAGPLTSFAAAGLFGLARIVVGTGSPTRDVIAAALGWLAWMNVLLGAFNLAPAAPLDGGRVLRAAVWARTRDRARAETIATGAGRVFGYLLITLGVLEFLSYGIVGLWFVFLGWFLLNAARAEQGSEVMRAALAGTRVRDLMTPDPVVFAPHVTIDALITSEAHRHHPFTTYPLVDADGRVVGLATLAQVRRVPPELRDSTTLIEVGRPLAEVPIAAPDDAAIDLLTRVAGSAEARALVLDGSRLVGVVSPRDVAAYVQLRLLRAGRK